MHILTVIGYDAGSIEEAIYDAEKKANEMLAAGDDKVLSVQAQSIMSAQEPYFYYHIITITYT